MSVTTSLINELFRGYHIQRWNERIRPMEFIEIDKHAHKMMIAYCLGKYEEDAGNEIDWELMIKDGIFEMLRRIVISDIKSTIYAKIKEHPEAFRQLNNYVYKKLEPKFDEPSVAADLKEFLLNPQERNNKTLKILDAAHIYSSYYEFLLIKQTNPFDYDNTKIQTELSNKLNKYRKIEGLDELINKQSIFNFIDKCGQLRFQYRWAQIPRITKTSVLGHSMSVAVLSYLFVRENEGTPKRLYNAFFGGLFHDLPEITTRDIISPVKNSSSELDALIKEIENELTEKEILPLLPKNWHKELCSYINDEFHNKITNEEGEVIGNLSVDEINLKYNEDKYNVHDGLLIRAADHLSAYIEAKSTIDSGYTNEDLRNATIKLEDLYSNERRVLGKTSLVQIYDSYK